MKSRSGPNSARNSAISPSYGSASPFTARVLLQHITANRIPSPPKTLSFLQEKALYVGSAIVNHLTREWLFYECRFRSQGQPYDKSRALSQLGFKPDAAAMFLHDHRIRDGQPL